jgi:uncharacterized protein (DUF2062 family)
MGSVNKLLGHLKDLWKKLISLKDSPHAIAGGVAIGIFVGFTPLWGIKTLLSLGLAYVLRCNPIAAVIAVSLHDVLTPFAPIFMRWQYDLGYWILSHPHHFPAKLEMLHHHLNPSDLLKWTTFFHVGLPLLVGSLLFSGPGAVIAYFATLGILLKRKDS